MCFCELIRDGAELLSSFETLGKEAQLLCAGAKNLTTVPSVRHAVLGILRTLCRNYPVSENVSSATALSATEMLKKIMVYIKNHITDQICLDEIAEYVCISNYHISREFKQIVCTTIFDYLNILRCREARQMLSEGYGVSKSALACGYENLSCFSRSFKRYVGTTPSEFVRSIKKGNQT